MLWVNGLAYQLYQHRFRVISLAPASPLYIHHERADPMHLRQVSRDDRFLFQNGGTVSLTGIDAISRKPIICRHDQFLDTVLRTVCYEHDIDTFQFKVNKGATMRCHNIAKLCFIFKRNTLSLAVGDSQSFPCSTSGSRQRSSKVLLCISINVLYFSR